MSHFAPGGDRAHEVQATTIVDARSRELIRPTDFTSDARDLDLPTNKEYTFVATNLRDDQSGPVELVPDRVDLAIYLTGWTLGWLLLWRVRPLPAPTDDPSPWCGARPGVAVIIPARNEQDALPHLLTRVTPHLGPQDEMIVVDDHSDDATARVATLHGARVITSPPLPPGWLGKPHACALGAAESSAPILLFVDADVQPAPDLVARIAQAVTAQPDVVTSIQPWHKTGSWAEQASVLCNVTALMGCGAFNPARRNAKAKVAFGPILAVDRTTYDRVGGHAAPSVRSMHTEDIGLARLVGGAELYTGRPDTTFQMYPEGFRQTIRGWTRSIATGARFTSCWIAIATLAWVWSLAGGWITMPIVFPLSALQFWILGRRAASIHPLTVLLYPLAVLAFVVISLRSLVTLIFGRRVEWKGRDVDAR